MKRKKQFYSWFGDETLSSHTPIFNHSEALKQVSGGHLFLGQLQQHKGKMITMITPQERLTGMVEQVYSDHIVFRNSERVYYIPITSLLYFYV